MRCPRCQAENLADSVVCIECGATRKVPCYACGGINPTDARFCRRCGASIGAPDSQRPPSPAAPADLAPTASTLSRAPAGPPPRRPRLSAVDWLLLGTLLPLAVCGFVMTVIHGIRGDFVVTPFLASSAADHQSYPVVSQLWSSLSAEAGQLRVGDRLLRLEGTDLRGLSN